MGRRRLRLLIVALLVAASMAFSGVVYETTGSDATSTHTMKVGTLTRSWVQIDPASRVTDSTPIVVVLSGINATTSQEISRDGLVPYVSDGKAELVYPVAVGASWNADGCCGLAATDNVNDVAFLQALVARVDPGHRRPVYLVGYSNGGRMAYRMACTDPALFDATAVVKAMPEPGCVVSGPLTILQVDSTNDYAVSYQPGDVGEEQPAATVEVARLRAADRCTSAAANVTHGSLKLQTWSHCRDGSMVAFATYQGGAHSWPEGTATTPSAASVIWNFFSASRTAASEHARSGVWC
jgi:polyhydroxybutyrate depolymerase